MGNIVCPVITYAQLGKHMVVSISRIGSRHEKKISCTNTVVAIANMYRKCGFSSGVISVVI